MIGAPKINELELDTRSLEKRACCSRGCSGKCTASQTNKAITKGNGCGPAGWWNKAVPELIFNGCCNTYTTPPRFLC